MINELFDTRYGIESIILYINDTAVPYNFTYDFISKIEINTCLYNAFVDLIMFAEDKLFRLTIKKTIQELTPEDTVRIIIEDKDHNIIDRRFNFITSRDIGNNPKQGNSYYLMFRDVYGYVLTNIEYTKYITAHGYTGVPLKIVYTALYEALTPVIEINKSRSEKTKNLNVKCFESKLPPDDTITERFVMDKTILQNLSELMDMHNIKLFQNWSSINLWQNMSVDQLKQIDDKDGTELYSNECSSLYANKICDYIKMPKGSNTLQRVNFTAYKSMNGIHHEMQSLDFDDFLPMIIMNNNADKFRGLRQSMESSSSSKLDTLENLVRKSFDKYINNNTLIIYVRPFFKNISVGTKVSIRIHNNTEFIGDQAEGDLEYNGNWLIVQSTICNIGQNLICRLTLKRCDNMMRSDSSLSECESSSSESVDMSINRPNNWNSDDLGSASRTNLDPDLQKDIERRLAKIGKNNNAWNNVQSIKEIKALQRIKDVNPVLESIENARKVYLQGKKDAMLQLQRINAGISETVKTIEDIKKINKEQLVNAGLNLAANATDSIISNALKNGKNNKNGKK